MSAITQNFHSRPVCWGNIISDCQLVRRQSEDVELIQSRRKQNARQLNTMNSGCSTMTQVGLTRPLESALINCDFKPIGGW